MPPVRDGVKAHLIISVDDGLKRPLSLRSGPALDLGWGLGTVTGSGYLSPETTFLLTRWLTEADLRAGLLFRGLHLNRPTVRPLVTSSIRRLIKRATARAGVDADIAAELSGHSMSRTCAERLRGFAETVRDLVAGALVKHMDETGFRIDGKTQWRHVASTAFLTFYRVCARRGSLLANVAGIVVHDHWRPYYTMQGVLHALCNAHHLRELKALVEIEKEEWARKMQPEHPVSTAVRLGARAFRPACATPRGKSSAIHSLNSAWRSCLGSAIASRSSP